MKRFLFGFVALLGISAGQAQAAFVTYTNLANFQAAGSTSLETFNRCARWLFSSRLPNNRFQWIHPLQCRQR
jgi:hypothetical protein